MVQAEPDFLEIDLTEPICMTKFVYKKYPCERDIFRNRYENLMDKHLAEMKVAVDCRDWSLINKTTETLW